MIPIGVQSLTSQVLHLSVLIPHPKFQKLYESLTYRPPPKDVCALTAVTPQGF